MGKSIPSATRLQEFTRILSSDRIRQRPKHVNPAPRTRLVPPPEHAKSPRGLRVDPANQKLKMEENSSEKQTTRVPLAKMVADCARRWFQDTLKEAEAGDNAMQVLVGQMYYSGYGVPRDAQKGRAWINKASKVRNSVWKVSDKQPGYNASDSDSDDSKADLNQD